MSELKTILSQLNKKFGESYIGFYGKTSFNDYKRISFGVTSLDLCTGGGLPEGKVATLAGFYSTTKSTVAYSMIGEVHKMGGLVALIDTEGSFDPIWAAKFGVNSEKLVVCQPQTIEEVTDTMESLLLTKEFKLIVYDSVAATASSKELEASAESKSMGGIAWEVGLLMRKICARLKDTETSVLILNQLRDKVGAYGSCEYMPGGHQLRNQSDIMIYLRTSDWIGDKEAPTGITIKFRVAKNKTAPPLKVGSYELDFKGKINNEKSLIEEAVRRGIVGKSGAWYFYQDESKKIQGLDKFCEQLTKELFNEIRQKTLEAIKNGVENVEKD